MMKGLFSYLTNDLPNWYRTTTDVLNEINLQLNEKIKVISSSYSSTDYYSECLFAKTSKNIMSGDTLILFIVSNHTIKSSYPEGFKEILPGSCHKNKLSMSVLYKVWNNGDPTEYRIDGDSRDMFTNMITLKGTRFIIDAKGRINNSCSVNNEIVAPRVLTRNDGAIINAYAYDEPSGVYLPSSQKSLATIENGYRGLAVGITPTRGSGLSYRNKAFSHSEKCGGGDDIAFSISII